MKTIYRLTANPDLVLLISANTQTCIYNKTEHPNYQAKWAEYQAWLAAGNVPDPHVETVYAPLSIEQKLESIGLTVDSLKTVVGLKAV